MKHRMVPTSNVERFFAAAHALEGRLSDPEVMGLGLVYGKPGLGKSMALEAYHSGQKRGGRVRTVPVLAMAHWSISSMLLALLRAVGQEPTRYRSDAMFDELADSLISRPAVLLVDEIDDIAGHRVMIHTLKKIHDVTGSAVLMIGEERVDGLLRRFESFYSRFNRSAIVHLTHHTAEDIKNVVEQRCEVFVEGEVCTALYEESGGKSMRSVIDRIREIEAWCATNRVKQFTLKEWRLMTGPRSIRQGSRPVTALAGVASA
jgi:Cdc6-like AAA superfamily ATPase